MARVHRLLLVGAVLGAHLVLAATPAAAATTLREAAPASGATIASMPDFVRLTFSEIVTQPRIDVLGPTGQPVNSSPISPRGNTVLQPVQPVGAGLYTVRYEATGPDGVVVRGSYTFTLAPTQDPTSTATGSSVPGDPTPPPSPSAAAAPSPPDSEPGGTSRAAYLIGAAVLTLVGVGGVLLFRRRMARL